MWTYQAFFGSKTRQNISLIHIEYRFMYMVILSYRLKYTIESPQPDREGHTKVNIKLNILMWRTLLYPGQPTCLPTQAMIIPPLA